MFSIVTESENSVGQFWKNFDKMIKRMRNQFDFIGININSILSKNS